MTADRASRDLARKRLDRNIVVEAGAGTGKTTLLTDRILFLLLAGGGGEGIPITRIVALTFTEKAAGEIKVRLADRLNDLLACLDGGSVLGGRLERARDWLVEARRDYGATDEKIRQAAESALHELDRAPIGTIHYYCGALLRLYPLEAGLNPAFRVDEGEAFASLFQEEWGRWLEEELQLDSPRAAAWSEILPHVPLADLEALARELCRKPGPAGGSAAFLPRLDALRAALRELPAGKPLPKRGQLLDALARIEGRLAAVARAAENPGGPLPPDEGPWEESEKKWPKEWAGLEGESLFNDARGLANKLSPLGEAVLARARGLLAPFVDRCRARYRAQGWMGFDDLLAAARDLLAGSAARREIKARVGALLVDEFQDTDPVQGEILLFLAERADSEAARWPEIELAPGKLFIVGDPKQSIYRFRGADIRAYEAFVELVLRQGGVKCDLQTSYRSHAGLVEPVNLLFADIMTETPGLQPAYLPLVPRAEAPVESGGVELALVPEGDEHARQNQSAEARWIARWIVSHCGGRGWRLGDVALLFRSTAVLTVYMDALKEAGIPYLVESDRAFYDAPEVMDFLNLLRWAADPSDRASLAGLLRSPLVLLEDRHLPVLSEAGWDRWEVLPEGPREAVRDFYAKMNSLRLFLAEPLGDFARRALEETGLLEAAAAAYHGQQTVSNLMKLVRRAAEANASRGETLAGFIRRLSSDVDEGVEEGESPLGEERVDAVRLLTVHKAKGLEYKVVFLPNLSAKVQGGARRPAAFRRDWFEGRAGHRLLSKKWPDLAMEFMEQDERKREEREAVRLFYVAATRAREHLILVGSEKASRGSFLELLRSAAVFSGGFMELKGGLRLPVTVAERTGAAASWPGEERDKKPRLTPALARTWAKRRRVFEETQGRPLYETPSGRAREEKPFVPSEGLPVAAGEAALVGKLCHAVMERWDFKKKEGLEGAIKTAVRRLAAESPGVAGEAVSREAGEILAAFLASPAARELAAGEILAREAPFLYGERGVVVRGVADILHRREGRLWVADYKTDRVGPEGAAVQAARYAVQGAAYREAVRRSLNEPCGFEVIFLRTGERIPIDKTPDRV